MIVSKNRKSESSRERKNNQGTNTSRKRSDNTDSSRVVSVASSTTNNSHGKHDATKVKISQKKKYKAVRLGIQSK